MKFIKVTDENESKYLLNIKNIDITEDLDKGSIITFNNDNRSLVVEQSVDKIYDMINDLDNDKEMNNIRLAYEKRIIKDFLTPYKLKDDKTEHHYKEMPDKSTYCYSCNHVFKSDERHTINIMGEHVCDACRNDGAIND